MSMLGPNGQVIIVCSDQVDKIFPSTLINRPCVAKAVLQTNLLIFEHCLRGGGEYESKWLEALFLHGFTHFLKSLFLSFSPFLRSAH